MSIDPTQIGFAIQGPYRHGDGSWQFTLVLMKQPAILGTVPEIVGSALIHVKSDKMCAAMGQALMNVSQQLPPEIAIDNVVEMRRQ